MSTTLPRRLRTWRCTITGMSNLVQELHPNAPVVATTGMSPPCPRTAPSCTCRRNNGHVNTLAKNCNCGTPRAALSVQKPKSCTRTGKTTLSMNWTSPRRRPAQQGHRPPRRRKANAARRAASPTKPPPPPRLPPPRNCLPPPAASWRRKRSHLRVHRPARRHSP